MVKKKQMVIFTFCIVHLILCSSPWYSLCFPNNTQVTWNRYSTFKSIFITSLSWYRRYYLQIIYKIMWESLQKHPQMAVAQKKKKESKKDLHRWEFKSPQQDQNDKKSKLSIKIMRGTSTAKSKFKLGINFNTIIKGAFADRSWRQNSKYLDGGEKVGWWGVKLCYSATLWSL